MSIRTAFVKQFGEEQAAKIEAAACRHENWINNRKKGSDLFKWALLICISYECMSRKAFREDHGILAPWAKIKAWIKKHGHLDTHDGELFCGTYNEFMPKKKQAEKRAVS